jgi:hypothetical protein
LGAVTLACRRSPVNGCDRRAIVLASPAIERFTGLGTLLSGSHSVKTVVHVL